MGQLSGVKIAIAEDEGLLLHILDDILTLAGAEIVGVASDFDGALAFAKKERIDVAVLDIDLAGRESFPVALALKRRGIPVVFASGSELPGLPIPFRTAPFIRKPYAYRDLIGALKTAIGPSVRRQPIPLANEAKALA
jgi:DNA-binding response OmpR family regulator